MIVLGGLGSFAGAVIGAFFVLGVPEMLRWLAEYRILIFGLLLVAFMMFLPGGLADLVHRLLSTFRRKEETSEVSVISSEPNEILAANPVKDNVNP
jgi:branched-chain amino acid transport system permease protein